MKFFECVTVCSIIAVVVIWEVFIISKICKFSIYYFYPYLVFLTKVESHNNTNVLSHTAKARHYKICDHGFTVYNIIIMCHSIFAVQWYR